MSDVLNPVDVEQSIRSIANRISNGVRIVSDSYAAFLAAERDYDRAYAGAYLAHKGPAHEKKYAAELATADERQARDVADVAYRYADRTARALDAELRAFQSIGASVRAMYGGER